MNTFGDILLSIDIYICLPSSVHFNFDVIQMMHVVVVLNMLLSLYRWLLYWICYLSTSGYCTEYVVISLLVVVLNMLSLNQWLLNWICCQLSTGVVVLNVISLQVRGIHSIPDNWGGRRSRSSQGHPADNVRGKPGTDSTWTRHHSVRGSGHWNTHHFLLPVCHPLAGKSKPDGYRKQDSDGCLQNFFMYKRVMVLCTISLHTRKWWLWLAVMIIDDSSRWHNDDVIFGDCCSVVDDCDRWHSEKWLIVVVVSTIFVVAIDWLCWCNVDYVMISEIGLKK